jgi:hypothetical protein
VGVAVGVLVGVDVGVFVGALVGVFVGVLVGVKVGVLVGAGQVTLLEFAFPGVIHRNEKSEEWQIRLYEGTNLREWLVWSRYQNKGDIKRLIEYFTPKTRDSDTSNRETEHFANLEELTK